MSKLKTDWDSLPRASKIAAAIWPNLVDETTRRQMAQANPEMASRLGYSNKEVRETPNNYHLFPHFNKVTK